MKHMTEPGLTKYYSSLQSQIHCFVHTQLHVKQFSVLSTLQAQWVLCGADLHDQTEELLSLFGLRLTVD